MRQHWMKRLVRNFAILRSAGLGYITAISTHELQLLGYSLDERAEGEEGSQADEEGAACLRVRLNVESVGEVYGSGPELKLTSDGLR